MNLDFPQSCGDIIKRPDPRIDGFKSDAVMTGSPDAVARPKDWQEVLEILKHCKGNKVPLTVCGARTSMTGASVATNGLLLTTANFNRVIDIGKKDGRAYAIVEPGVVASVFQKEVEGCGFHYPVVPTSCDDAFVGGTVSTNATGEDFYRYGPTRSFVREMTVLTIDGREHTLTRTNNAPPPQKGRGGYFMGGEQIDEVIGSEGTLCIVKRIVFDLLPNVPDIFQLVIPFTSRIGALEFIDEINKGANLPRSLEYIDTTALEIMKTHPKCFDIAPRVKAMVFIKDETTTDPENAACAWLERIEAMRSAGSIVIEETRAAITDKQKEELHTLRHHIPAHIGELRERYEANGGGKTGGDWWVPRSHMLSVMTKFYEESEPLGIDFVAYGHLGEGHPHTNFLCKNADEKRRATEMALLQARHAALLGGGVAAEHGIGKTKLNLMPIQYSAEIIAQMRRLKERYDPNWLLCAGNILNP